MGPGYQQLQPLSQVQGFFGLRERTDMPSALRRKGLSIFCGARLSTTIALVPGLRVFRAAGAHRHAERLAQEGALHLLPLDAQGREGGVAAVALEVGDEVADDRRRDDVPDVLRVVVLAREGKQ